MKTAAFILFFLTGPLLFSYAQNQTIKVQIFDKTEQMPEFPGGPDSLMAFLVKNLKYPESALNINLQGVVRVKFVTDEHGKVTRYKILRSDFTTDEKFKKVNDSFARRDLEKEALRVVALMPDWKPGYQNGKAVKVFFTLPVTYELAD